jgi:hypothetical protein
VARDSAFTLTFTLAEGYDLVAVKVNGQNHQYAVDGNGYTITVPKVAASISVSIEVAIRKYRIVLTPIGVSIAEPTGANPHFIDHNGSLTVRVTIAENYFSPVNLIRIDGSIIAATPSGNEYVATIPNITANDSICIKADDGIRRITIHKDSRVTLVGATDTVREIRTGAPFTVTFTVPAGYEPKVTLQDGSIVTTLSTGEANTYEAKIPAVSTDATIAINLGAATGIADVDLNDPVVSIRYYNLQGQEVRQPSVTGIYILRKQHLSGRVTMEKRLIVED